MKRKHFLFTILFISVTGLFAFEPVPTEKLLLSYLENDVDLQKLTISAEKANLTYETSKLDSGIDITLSTGVISFKTSKNGLSCKTSPTIKLNIPKLHGLSVTTGTTLTTSNPKVFTDTSISVDMDIISPNKLTDEINMLNAERTRSQSIKNLEEKAIDKEKSFYTELKTLLNSMSSIIQSEKKLYNDIKDFETVKARGFSENSATYRTAEIQVFSDQNTIDSQKKSFINDFTLFYKKCGYTINLPYDIDIMTLIPTDIISIIPIDIDSFYKEDFKELENANWNHKINSMKREINNDFSLSANAGITFENSMTNSHTLNLGATSSIKGVNLQAGINIPLSSTPYPSFTLSAGFSPKTLKKNEIREKQDILNEQQELLDIKVAENNYETFIINSKKNLEELYYRKDLNQKNYDMYKSLEKDMKGWFNLGIVSESDYLSAKTNADLNKIKLIINDIDFLIYNDDVNKKFTTSIITSETDSSSI